MVSAAGAMSGNGVQRLAFMLLVALIVYVALFGGG